MKNKDKDQSLTDNIQDSQTLKNKDDKFFPIIGIGGATGSIIALEHFFKHMPAHSGMAFVLVFHKDSEEAIDYVQIVQSYTPIPVSLVEDGTTVMPDHIYISPCDVDTGIHQGKLLLFQPSKDKDAQMCIDYFFQSLAEDQGKRAVGIVLSGLGADGETGVRMIKEQFGLTMAQDPDTAEQPNMPLASMQTQMVDYVLAVEEMPRKLIQYLNHPALRLSEEDDDHEAHQDNSIYIQKILLLLRSNTGHDFSLYKTNTIFRRIDRRIAFHRLHNYEEYVTYLRENPSEIEALLNELLIGVTKFFRDRKAFDILTKQIHRLLKKKQRDEPIRIWVAGCSTGEEAYSVAIIVSDFLEQHELKRKPKVQIFATDLDANAIEHARTGFYFSNIASELSAQQLDRYFIKKNNGFAVKKEIRELIVFAQHNLVKDAPFTRLDLVCCRNVMIYLTTELQKKILPIFHYSLHTGGILFLGPAESISGFHDIFEILDSKWKIFQRKEGISTVGKFLDFPFHIGSKEKKSKKDLQIMRQKSPLAEDFNRLLIDHHTPPSLLLNERGEILYVNGQTNRFIQLQAGEAVMNIHRMIREELKYVLGNALHQASTTQQQVEVQDIKVKEGNRLFLISFSVNYLIESSLQGLLMVTFHERELTEKELQKTKKNNNISESALNELQKELLYTKQQLHQTIEQMEISLEELKSTNEELQSTNEELQSTNEEALTTREEMQTLNEQLMTINMQYQKKAEELSVLQNDIKNLYDNSDEGTIFLDLDLHILRYSTQASRLLHLELTDIGKEIIPFFAHFQYNDLSGIIRSVIDTLNGREIELKTANNDYYLLRITPYRTTENFISGATLTFTKTTAIKALQYKAIALTDVIQRNIDLVNEAVVLLYADQKILAYNHQFQKLFPIIKGKSTELYFSTVVRSIGEMETLSKRIDAIDQIEEQISISYLRGGIRKQLLVSIEKIRIDIPDQFVLHVKFEEI